jgi:predicted nucleotidyltransferase component of viral defense system
MNPKEESLKAKIRNLAKEMNISAQVLLQNYLFECFLDRLSHSEYHDKFVLKGGMLIAAIVGLGNRSTMDLDTTVRGFPLTENSIKKALNVICAIDVSDGIIFTIDSIKPIRADDLYGGFRVALTGKYNVIAAPLSIDLTTGDVITPDPVYFTLNGILDESRKISLWAYNIETILAEKLETILRRNILNTRPRDFYDVYILLTTQKYDKNLLMSALDATAFHRGTIEQIADRQKILHLISDNEFLLAMWEKYRKQYDFANKISYNAIIECLKTVFEIQNPY